jgi:PAS domain S-box-containing protein
LHEERALSSTVLAMVDALVMTVDVQGNIVSLNRACQQTAGFALEEIHGKPFCGVFAVPEEMHLVEGTLRRAVQGKAACELESSLPTKGGSRRRISWSLRPMCDPSGCVRSVVLSGTDRSEHLDALEQLQQARIAAERSAGELKKLRELVRQKDFTPESPAAPSAGLPGESPSPPKATGTRQPFQPVATKTSKEQRSSPRRAYQYRQLIAPLCGEAMPGREEFQEVVCEDISAGGISFYLPTAPEFTNLVVALGKPPMLTYSPRRWRAW